jgi:hypothetical protein
MTSREKHRHWMAEHAREAIYQVKWRNKWLRWKAGRRGTFLAILATVDISYGFSLVLRFTDFNAMPPGGNNIVPLSFRQWGAVWIACGVFLFTGVLAKHDIFQFALASLIKFSWAAAILIHWTKYRNYPDVSPIIWVAVALIVLLVSGWPEQVTSNGPWKPPAIGTRK